MRVIKRDGTYEDISFDKVLHRIRKLCNGLTNVSADVIAQQVCSRIYDGVRTSELDELAAQLCAGKITEHPDYGVLASRIVVSNHQKKTSPSFSETMSTLYNAKDLNGNINSLISEELYQIVMTHKDKLNQVIDYDRDFDITYFGHKTLERSYLTKVNGKIVERTQHLWMRVALGIHGWDLKEAIDTYNYMSLRKFTHATPTLFNAGTKTAGLSSCFLLGLEDSISGIYKNLGDCAQISKTAGGIGIHVHNIRAKNSYIRGTNGTSSGIIPMLRVFNETAKYVNQCFTADTLIYTDKGCIRIYDVSIGTNGTLVLTSDNTYKPVLDMFETQVDKEILEIRTSCSTNVVNVTKEHIIYTLNENKELVEIEAKKLTTSMLLGYPTNINIPSEYIIIKNLHNMNWVEIELIRSKMFKGFVYDLSVEDNHNYVTDIGLVHNSGRRNGSIAVYLEPWHADIQSFIELRKNSGNEEERTRDLFTALWVSDLFMKRVQENGDWHLMCPDECPRLSDTFGEEFETLYQSYIDVGKFRKVIKAQELWVAILKSQIETGTPYMSYKDHVNRKTNQANLGVIKSSNLCNEICQHSDSNNYASCNLASISLPAFVKKRDDGEMYYDFDELHSITQVVIRNLNKVIDKCYYSMDEIKRPNMQTRPLGLGVQGLADVFFLMKLPFESKEAAEINRQIAETMYHAALTSSMLIAKKRNELLDEYEDSGVSVQRKTEIAKYLMLIDEERDLTSYRGAYSKFVGSPIHSGKLQFDQWEVTPSDKYDWVALKESIAKYGVRNSLLIAYMPTASSSQILGNYESFEPVTSNVFVRDTLAGNFIIPNKYLINDLIERGLWNSEMKDRLVGENGSIQNIPGIPDDVKQLYKTVYEVKQKAVIDMSAARGAYICQSQSLNIYLPDADINRLSNVHLYGWKSGLKTGSYYTRILQAVRMTNYAAEVKDVAKEEQIAACSRDNKEACMMCSG